MNNIKAPQPMYRNISDKLRSKILQGKWKSGFVIPPELELCKQFSTSRTTIRKAIKNLTDEGYLSRKAGKGTWVTDKREDTEIWRYQYSSDYPFPEQAKVEVLQIDHLAADPSDSLFNGFPDGEMITRLKVLRSLRDTPLVYTEIHMTEGTAEKVMNIFKPNRDTYFFKLVERVTGSRIIEVHESFNAVLAVGEVAERLRVMDSSPLNTMTRLFFNENKYLVQSSRVYLRPDVNTMKIVRVREL